MKTQGTQGPESYDERVKGILRDNWDVVPKQPGPPHVYPPPDFERGPKPPYGHGRDIQNSMNGLFGVPPQHLQQMAGNVLYPTMGTFFPPNENQPWVPSQRFENSGKPAGYQNADPNAVAAGVLSGKVLTLVPRGW